MYARTAETQSNLKLENCVVELNIQQKSAMISRDSSCSQRMDVIAREISLLGKFLETCMYFLTVWSIMICRSATNLD